MPTMTNSQLPLFASAANLSRLVLIRTLVLSGLTLALAYAAMLLDADIPYSVLLCTLVAMATVNIATYWRLRQGWPVTDQEYFGQLLVDVTGLTVLLYHSGGATNPFVSYYLVPLTISAAVLPWRYTWFIAGSTLTAYSLMLFYYLPLPDFSPQQHQHGNPLNLHIIGMWFNFAISTTLITVFVVKMATTLRSQEQLLNTNREDVLRDEQILAVASLAAGTAHELGTPMSTMTVLLDELADEYQQQEGLSQDLTLLQQQVQNCTRILQGLVTTAQTHSQGQQQRVLVDDYIRRILDHWQLLRPQAHFHFNQTGSEPAPVLLVDITLEQAIDNLLNNAADACEQALEITLHWSRDEINLSIRDHGPGIPLDIAEQLGKPYVSTKGGGLGLGLFLSHATIARYGGTITLHNHPEGGTQAQLTLPTGASTA
jgi:two-component system sensor histidine kinase RegB